MTTTKTRILDAALGLFNAAGTAGTSTNHIAEALGMSPGNLYYHFGNKAEIVRALFARIAGEWADNYAVPPDVMPTIAMMEQMVAGNFEIQARYLFFFRDLSLLLSADPELAAAYQANRAEGIERTKILISAFIEVGVISPIASDEERDDLAQMLWLVGDFWLVFKVCGGSDCGPAEMAQGVRLFRRAITPYLTGHTK